MHNRQNPDDHRRLLQEAISASPQNSLGRAQEMIEAVEGAATLRQLDEFEHQLENAGYSTVFEFIGRPALKAPDRLSPDEMVAELDALFALLAEHGIAVDFISDVDDHEAYRFLVEDLMPEEIQQIRVPGWTQHFIYEEFFPEKFEDLFELDDDDMDWNEGDIPF